MPFVKNSPFSPDSVKMKLTQDLAKQVRKTGILPV